MWQIENRVCLVEQYPRKCGIFTIPKSHSMVYHKVSQNGLQPLIDS